MTDRAGGGDRARCSRARSSGSGSASPGSARQVVRASAGLDLEPVLPDVTDERTRADGRHGLRDRRRSPRTEPRGTSSPPASAEEEHQQLAQWPDAAPALRASARPPRRRPDRWTAPRTSAGSASRGSASRRGASGGWPTRHRGVHVGNFYLLKEECAGEFTAEDGEILALFASRAATAVTAARTHRAVERARADLEAVIETSPPVGVVVFDAVTGRPISINRESLRIVDRLRSPARIPRGAPRRGDVRTSRRPRAAPSDHGRQESGSDGHRVRAPARSLARCRTGVHLRNPDAARLGPAGSPNPKLACTNS